MKGLYINGLSIKTINIDLLRSKIGAVFQRSNIYSVTVQDNLSLYDDINSDNMNQIITVLDMKDKIAEEDINRYFTKEFDDNGIVLSKGEEQKIALGRILSNEFGLILLDEPSSSLDPLAEKKMLNLLNEKCQNATRIMIAHRLSTIRDADVIYVFDNGSIIEKGTHDQLMAKEGKYYQMFTAQASDYK